MSGNCRLVSLVAVLVLLPGVGQSVRSEPATRADDQAAAELAAAAVMDRDPGVREEAVRGLRGRLADIELPALQQALLDVDARVRVAAVETLADIGGDDAVSALAGALADEDAALREEVVYALGKIGGPAAVAVLEQARGDSHDAVRDAATDILLELAKEALPRWPAKDYLGLTPPTLKQGTP